MRVVFWLVVVLQIAACNKFPHFGSGDSTVAPAPPLVVELGVLRDGNDVNGNSVRDELEDVLKSWSIDGPAYADWIKVGSALQATIHHGTSEREAAELLEQAFLTAAACLMKGSENAELVSTRLDQLFVLTFDTPIRRNARSIHEMLIGGMTVKRSASPCLAVPGIQQGQSEMQRDAKQSE